VLCKHQIHAQCAAIPKRIYANKQYFIGEGVAGILSGTIENPNNAINGNLRNFSTLKVPIGINIQLPWPLNGLLELKSSATQFLEFTSGTQYIPANKPVTVKLRLPVSLLGVLNKIELQPFKNLTGTANNGSATAVGTPFSLASLVNVANGSGDIEMTVTPSENYQGIWIKLASTLALDLSLNIYEAYIIENETSENINCDAPIDILSGVKAGTAIGGIASATGSVSDPWNAVDNNPDSFTQFNLGVQVLSEVFETVVFTSPSQANDWIEIILQKSDGGLLDLNLLTGFSIQPYLGTTAVGSSLTATGTFLSLSLLSGTNGSAKYLLRAKIPHAFDRVEIKMGGLAGVLSSLKIYEVKRKILPGLLVNNTTPSEISSICEGESVTLNINGPQSCTKYYWYDTAVGGTALAIDTTFTTPIISLSKTYYAQAIRNNGCNNSSERVPVPITINPAPAITLGTMPEICLINNQAIIPFGELTNAPQSYKIEWNQAALDASFVNIEQKLPNQNELIIAIPPNASPAIYKGTLTVKNSNGCYSYPAKPIQINIKPEPPAPNLIIQTYSQY
jgi:hypothetical protein